MLHLLIVAWVLGVYQVAVLYPFAEFFIEVSIQSLKNQYPYRIR